MISQKSFQKFAVIFSVLFVFLFSSAVSTVFAEDQPAESISVETTAVPEDLQRAIEMAADESLKEELRPEEVEIDTTIEPEDLGVKKARLLPDNPLYGFKDIFRGVRSALTFDPIKKAEYRLKVTNEKMVEAKQLIEDKKTDKAKQIASKVIENVNKDFDKIVKQGDKLKQLKQKNAPEVDKFLNKVADHSLKQQVLLQKLEEQVSEESFARIERARQQHLERFGQVMNKVSENKEEIRDRFAKVVENQQGSDFREMKAVEILRDLEDKVGPEAKEALRMAQTELSRKFETRFLELPPETREQKFSQYMEYLPGNPVRQFEALDRMKQSFQSADAVPVLEIGKDRAVRKFEDRFGQFENQETRDNFMEPWRNGDPEDLRIMTEIQMRIEPPELAKDPTASAVFQEFKPFQEEARQNFRQRFEENPDAIKNDPAFRRMRENPDVVDLRFSQDLNEIMKRPDRSEDPSAENFVREFQEESVQNFVENMQRPSVPPPPPGERPAGFVLPPDWQDVGFGAPVPGGLEVLQEIKDKLPPQAQRGMNQAIDAQTRMIERHIQKTDDPVMFQRFEKQIENNPEIKKEIQERRGDEFFNKVDQRGREMEKVQQGQEDRRWQKMQEINNEMFGPEQNEPGRKPAEQSGGVKILPQEMKSKIQEFRKIIPQGGQLPQLNRPEPAGEPNRIKERRPEAGAPERPVIPLPGSPGFKGPENALPKPEEINPPPQPRIEIKEPVREIQPAPLPPAPTEPTSQNLFQNLFATVSRAFRIW